MTNIGEIRPTILIAVPRIFEKAYARINQMVDEGGAPKRQLFKWAMQKGASYYGPIWEGKRPSFRDTVEYRAAQALVFSKIAARFGGRLRYTLCGGAPLPREIAEYFRIAGVEILEGYGLTETCAPLTFNTPDATKLGTVGRPLSEVTLKIGEDGEILAKTRKLFTELLQDAWKRLKKRWPKVGSTPAISATSTIKVICTSRIGRKI